MSKYQIRAIAYAVIKEWNFFTLVVDFLSPIISCNGTPKTMRGFVNLSHNNMFSSLLHSIHPEMKLQKTMVAIKTQHEHQLSKGPERAWPIPGTLEYKTCDFASMRARLRLICQKNIKGRFIHQ